jgi:uracil-DNA glycosylase family 4
MSLWNDLTREIVDCNRCPRLRQHCLKIAAEKRRSFREWTYWGRPVPNFGQAPASLLVIGLAPAAHGGNRTGRIFTGDSSGDWLYRALYRAGFCNQPTSVSIDDGLELLDCVITAVGHCAPPDNKPTREELAACEPFLRRTIEVAKPKVFVALGGIAWKATVDQLRTMNLLEGRVPAFKHGTEAPLVGGRTLIASYHPSQRNTFTGLLTEPMFDAIFSAARKRIGGAKRRTKN